PRTQALETRHEVSSVACGKGRSPTDRGLLQQIHPSRQIPSTRDYEDEFYSNSNPSYEVTGSFSGGTAATQYYVNLTSRDEVGTAPRTGARLYSVRTNVDQSFLEGKVKVNVGLNVTRNSLNRGLSNNDNTCTSPKSRAISSGRLSSSTRAVTASKGGRCGRKATSSTTMSGCSASGASALPTTFPSRPRAAFPTMRSTTVCSGTGPAACCLAS